MIILGELHKFKEYELNDIKKKYKTINFIKYNQEDTKQVIDAINEIKDKRRIDFIVLNTLAKVPKDLIAYLIHLDNKNIKFITIKTFLEQELQKYYIPSTMNDVSFLSNIKPYTAIEYIQKRFIDYIISIPLLIISSPVMLYAAYKIKKESPDGPVFFKQKRVGLHNKEFDCIKFRSMRTDIDYHNDYTQEDDPRIFPWGDFMRKSRIDELPQLINVFKGQMHLLGPRAEWNKLVYKYQEQIPFYNTRHLVKPGITGWAQVKYRYGANLEDTKEKLMYDLYYIKNWSLWLEIKTICLTAKVVMGKKGL